MKRQIEIKINKDGTIEARTIGVTGKQCEEYILLLEELLEARTLSSEYTEDYYLPETVTNDMAVKDNRGRIKNHD